MPHTPGPYVVNREGANDTLTVQSDNYTLAIIVDTEGDDAEFTAKLFAAAPELLEACKLAADVVRIARIYFPKSVQNSDRFTLENSNAAISAAIAKATE